MIAKWHCSSEISSTSPVRAGHALSIHYDQPDLTHSYVSPKKVQPLNSATKNGKKTLHIKNDSPAGICGDCSANATEHASGHRSCHKSSEMALAGKGWTSLASRFLASSNADFTSGVVKTVKACSRCFCDGRVFGLSPALCWRGFAASRSGGETVFSVGGLESSLLCDFAGDTWLLSPGVHPNGENLKFSDGSPIPSTNLSLAMATRSGLDCPLLAVSVLLPEVVLGESPLYGGAWSVLANIEDDLFSAERTLFPFEAFIACRLMFLERD
jgi:hypothetical protein